jgi:hypothetical protein
MKCRPWFRGRLAGGTVRLALAVLAFAGVSTTARAFDELPHRAARLSYLEGNVTVDRANNTGSDKAQLNMPIAEGQRISTGDSGQAEVEFEDGSVVRLTPYSSLSLDSLSADADGNFQTQMTVVRGLVYAELRSAPKYTYRLIAGGDVISPVENTTLRVNMDEPPAVISVLSGTAHVESGDSQTGYRTDVRAGESLKEDASSSGRYFLTQQIAQDSWDAWNEQRDQQAADEAANRTSARDTYAGQQGYGWSDLDANGTWYDIPSQGPVWQPTIALDASFDPYGYGSWVWYPSLGYVWASGYSWGWTPFRCGSWSYWNGFGWGWSPGAVCGACGWGFGHGGVYVINVVQPPRGYHFHPLPGHGPTGLHPIVVVRPGRGPAAPVHPPQQGLRTIAGQTVFPLRPVGHPYTPRGGSAVGSALRRDFPVDRGTHQPVIGTTNSPAMNSGADTAMTWRAVAKPSPATNGISPATNGIVVSGRSSQPIRPGPPMNVGHSMIARPQGQPIPRAMPAERPIETMSHPVFPGPVVPRPITPPSVRVAPQSPMPHSTPPPVPPPAAASHPSPSSASRSSR